MRARRRQLSAGYRCRRLSAPHLDGGASCSRATFFSYDDALAAGGSRLLTTATGLRNKVGAGGRLQVREESVWGREGARVVHEIGYATAGVPSGGRWHWVVRIKQYKERGGRANRGRGDVHIAHIFYHGGGGSPLRFSIRFSRIASVDGNSRSACASVNPGITNGCVRVHTSCRLKGGNG